MPFLNKGVWTLDDSKKPAGFLASAFNNWITKDGQPGRTGKIGFKAESGRYHVYIGKGCPFANRVTIMMHLKGLFKHVSVSYCAPQMYQENRWGFVSEPGYKDDLYGKDHLHQIYAHLAPGMSGSCSVPLLVCKKTNEIVSTDSANIATMFGTAFNELVDDHEDYSDKNEAEFNEWLVPKICVGIYHISFAPDDEKYEAAFNRFFETADKLDKHLEHKKFTSGDEKPSEVDIKVFCTLIRFDVAYYFLYKANLKRMYDYPNIHRWLKTVYQYKNIGEAVVDFPHVKKLYYGNVSQNPSQRVPLGPFVDYSTPVEQAL